MRAPVVRLFNELVVDSFAGGGGASVGIEMALGRSPDIAINHDREALSMHAMNHPTSQHLCEDVWAVDPVKATNGRPVGLMWLSPDCKHFSKAKGGKPVEKKIRGLAWVAVRWAKAKKPRVIVLENVEEFADWGPLNDDGMPCKLRKGKTFKRFVRQLENCGYAVDWQMLVAADYGSPTIRKRLFLIARCDGEAIVWPEPSHGYAANPWRTAAECIEWDIPCPSIFERERPLAENTLRRIARGIQKYVIETPQPFIVPMQHVNRATTLHEPLQTVTTQGNKFNLVTPFMAPLTHAGDARAHSPVTPLRTIAGAHRGEHALVTPLLSAFYGVKGKESRCSPLSNPLPTQTADPRFGLISPTLIQTGYGERPGQEPRAPGLHKPLGTCVDGQKHALVSAFMAKHYGGHETPGKALPLPFDTVTAHDHHALTAANLLKFKGTSRDGQAMQTPLHTVQAGGNRAGVHYALVRAFLMKFYSEGGQWSRIREPMHTVPSKDRMGLVTVAGEDYAITDIGMRMLQPRELFRAQGFPDSYVIDRGADGVPLTKSAQVRMCGNSVCPPVAAAIVAANYGVEAQRQRLIA